MFRPSTRLGSGARACLSTLAVGATVMLTVAGLQGSVLRRRLLARAGRQPGHGGGTVGGTVS